MDALGNGISRKLFLFMAGPITPDGTLTSKTYTGGCIRLDTDDAKEFMMQSTLVLLF